MRAALIGYGYWGKIIRKYIDENCNFDLLCIYTKNPDPEERKKSELVFTQSLEAVLYDYQIEAAFVCTPIETHYEICKTLLLSGIYVFCEKPTVRRQEEFDILTRIAESRHKILYTDYIYLLSPSIKKMKEIIPLIGDINAIEGEISQFGNFYPDDTVFEVLGVHLLSVLVYLVPDIKIKSCEVLKLKDLPLYGGRIQMVVNDDISILFICNLLNAKKIRTIKIYGTKGSILFDMMDKEITLRFQQYVPSKEGTVVKIENQDWNFDESNNLTKAIQEFYNAIQIKDNSQNMLISKKIHHILNIIM